MEFLKGVVSMYNNDAILALLADIKDILYGIAFLLLGGILCLAGLLLLGTWGLVLLLIGVPVELGGLLYTRHGYRHHEVVENEDQTTNMPNS